MFEFRSEVLKDKIMSTLFKVMVRSHHQLGHLAILTRDEPGLISRCPANPISHRSRLIVLMMAVFILNYRAIKTGQVKSGQIRILMMNCQTLTGEKIKDCIGWGALDSITLTFYKMRERKSSV